MSYQDTKRKQTKARSNSYALVTICTVKTTHNQSNSYSKKILFKMESNVDTCVGDGSNILLAHNHEHLVNIYLVLIRQYRMHPLCWPWHDYRNLTTDQGSCASQHIQTTHSLEDYRSCWTRTLEILPADIWGLMEYTPCPGPTWGSWTHQHFCTELILTRNRLSAISCQWGQVTLEAGDNCIEA